mmetsp:Transcript_94539/g.164019  ORF Transcript_94539/g.164019 Transcript_94539/m.164019 type:complete len:158 (-) Transcript_94539:126-599(-)
MSTCEWRRDLPGGELVNFWSWSSVISFDEAIEDLTREIESQNPTAILFKSAGGFATQVLSFATPQEAIDHIMKIDPARMGLTDCEKMVNQQATVPKEDGHDPELAKVQEAIEKTIDDLSDAETDLDNAMNFLGREGCAREKGMRRSWVTGIWGVGRS